MPDDLLSTDRPGTRYGFGSRGEDRFKEDEELAAADMEPDPSSYEAAGSEAAEAELDMIVRQAEVVRQKLQSGQTEATPAQTAATTAVSLEPPYSPWEAEPQNITGVFRLKSKEDARPAKERTSGSAGSTTSDPGAADDKKDSQASAAYNKTVAQTLQSQAIETGFVSSAGTVGSTCASKESKEGKPEEEPWWSESESKDSRQLELSLGEDSEPEDPETSTKNREDKHVSAGASLPGTGELNPWELGSDSQES